MSEALLAIDNLSKRFGGFVALDNISLSIPAGERLGLIGPNGSGKSTLVNCICGTLHNEQGSVHFDGKKLEFKLGRISRSYFERKFGVDVLTRFAEPIATLKSSGDLTLEGDFLRLTRDGLLQVDRLVHEFFLPQHRTARYA